MRDSVERNSAGFAEDPNEDTIELVIGSEDLLSLSRTAAAAESEYIPVDPVPPDPVDAPPSVSTLHCERRAALTNGSLKLRWPRVPFEAATVMVVTAIALATAAYRSANSPDRARVPISAATPIDFDATAAAPEGEPVRFRNPFDPEEIFEFPPGTSYASARESVAEVLLERGRDRLDHPTTSHRLSAREADRDARGRLQSTPGIRR
jgi:hypothetical protein